MVDLIFNKKENNKAVTERTNEMYNEVPGALSLVLRMLHSCLVCRGGI